MFVLINHAAINVATNRKNVGTAVVVYRRVIKKLVETTHAAENAEPATKTVNACRETANACFRHAEKLVVPKGKFALVNHVATLFVKENSAAIMVVAELAVNVQKEQSVMMPFNVSVKPTNAIKVIINAINY